MMWSWVKAGCGGGVLTSADRSPSVVGGRVGSICGYRLSSRLRRRSSVFDPQAEPYGGAMSPSSRLWVERLPSTSLSAVGSTSRWSGRGSVVDAGVCLLAAGLGALFLSPALHGDVVPLPTVEVVVDVACGLLACLSLWWRRRWAVGVALVCVLLGTFSISATPAGLLALFSLAVHRPVRPALLMAALFVGSALLFAVYSATTDPVSVFLRVAPLALAVTAWGMFVRARRHLLLSLEERALRAEADQRLHEDRARMAERTRIAREMHDVLAHRIFLLALHAGGTGGAAGSATGAGAGDC